MLRGKYPGSLVSTGIRYAEGELLIETYIVGGGCVEAGR